jgi:hypothetical protein
MDRRGIWARTIAVVQRVMPPMFSPFVDLRASSAEVEQDADPLARYDVGDEVDAEHYPDGVYWRFVDPTTCGKRLVVKDHAVAEVTDVLRDAAGDFFWATRRQPVRRRQVRFRS